MRPHDDSRQSQTAYIDRRVAYLLLPILYWVGIKAESAFILHPEQIALLCLPSAVLLAFAIEARREEIWHISLLALAAEVVASLSSSSLQSAVVNWAVNMIEVFTALALLRVMRTASASAALAFAKFVIAGPVLGALIGAIVDSLVQAVLLEASVPNWRLEFRQLWYRDAVGMMVIAPACIALIACKWPKLVRPRPMDIMVLVATILVLAAMSVGATVADDDMTTPPMLLLPFVLYLAARSGFIPTVIGVAAISIGIALQMSNGFLLFGPLPARQAMVHAQVFLFVLSALAMSFAALLDEVRTHDAKLERTVRKRTQQLCRVNEELTRLARTDPLTGLLNRRALLDVMRQECSRATRYGRLVSILVIDVDRFKLINDRYGHPFGDEVLRRVAEAIRKTLRADDSAARLGGEEFVVVAPETNSANGILLAERLRAAVSSMSVQLGSDSAKVTASVGVAVVEADEDAEFVLGRADKALYLAKANGRNRVELWRPQAA